MHVLTSPFHSPATLSEESAGFLWLGLRPCIFSGRDSIFYSGVDLLLALVTPLARPPPAQLIFRIPRFVVFVFHIFA